MPHAQFIHIPGFCKHECTIRSSDGWRCGCGHTWKRRPDTIVQRDGDLERVLDPLNCKESP